MPAEVFPPGVFIQEELEARGMSREDLAKFLDLAPPLISELIAGKGTVTPETARGLALAFGTDAQFWLNLESTYQRHRPSPPLKMDRQERLKQHRQRRRAGGHNPPLPMDSQRTALAHAQKVAMQASGASGLCGLLTTVPAALEHAQRVAHLSSEICAMIISGDLRGALARMSFLVRSLGQCLGGRPPRCLSQEFDSLLQELGACLEEMNAALPRANEAGYLPPLQ